MHQNLCRSFTAAVLVSSLGMPLAAQAESIPSQDSSRGDLDSPAVTAPVTSLLTESATPASRDQATPSSQVGDLALDRASSDDLIRIIPHPLDEQQAATLYVNDIPVLTFVGDAPEAAPDKSATASPTSALDRAATTAEQLQHFHQAPGDPDAIGVRWDADLETYLITLAETPLVAVNETTMLPDTTGDAAQDALQATNRLRRLLGPVAPLSDIEGQPEPVAAVRDWDVTSAFTGRASWYGPGFHGRRTASGEVFDQDAMTAAHRTLPFGTRVRVTNLRNNQQVIVRINDRGPYSHGRVLDLSAGAARAIGLQRAGVGPVRVEVLTD